MKNKITGILSILIMGLALLASLVFAIFNLVNLSGLKPLDRIEGKLEKGKFVEGELYIDNEEFYSIQHKINGLIPIGTEHYYFAIDEDNRVVYYVRSGKNAYRKTPQNSKIKIKGKVKKGDSKFNRDFQKLKEEINESGYGVGYSTDVLFIDTEVGKRAVINIIGVILIFASLLAIFLSPVKYKPANELTAADKIIVFAALFGFIIGGVLLISLPVFM